jgi:hypothetical protein
MQVGVQVALLQAVEGADGVFITDNLTKGG